MHEYLYIHTHELGFIMSAEDGIVKSWRLKAVSSRPTFAWLWFISLTLTSYILTVLFSLKRGLLYQYLLGLYMNLDLFKTLNWIKEIVCEVL